MTLQDKQEHEIKSIYNKHKSKKTKRLFLMKIIIKHLQNNRFPLMKDTAQAINYKIFTEIK